MDKKWIAIGCAGLMTGEALEYGISGGKKAPPPGGQPHIEVPTSSTSPAAGVYVVAIVTSSSTFRSS